jgi:hypothetical protein
MLRRPNSTALTIQALQTDSEAIILCARKLTEEHLFIEFVSRRLGALRERERERERERV